MTPEIAKALEVAFASAEALKSARQHFQATMARKKADGLTLSQAQDAARVQRLAIDEYKLAEGKLRNVIHNELEEASGAYEIS